jgi:hypothetical protein
MGKKYFDFSIDDTEIQKILDKFSRGLEKMAQRGMVEMADSLLVLSRLEVPHDIGDLQKSGSVFNNGPDDIGVVYNIEYASYQHEGGDGKRVITKYQKGRKKKYLEDPMKKNMSKFMEIGRANLEGEMTKL